MKNKDRAVMAALLSLSFGFVLAAGVTIYYQEKAQAKTFKQREITANADVVIGPRRDFSGDLLSPYTLVEFGDYQCPPCRASDRLLQSAMIQYRGKLRFAFSNLPLTGIHPFAMSAAVAAEAAREQGKFWPMLAYA